MLSSTTENIVVKLMVIGRRIICLYQHWKNIIYKYFFWLLKYFLFI